MSQRTHRLEVQMDPEALAELILGNPNDLDIPDLGAILGTLHNTKVTFYQTRPTDLAGLRDESRLAQPPTGTVKMTLEVVQEIEEKD